MVTIPVKLAKASYPIEISREESGWCRSLSSLVPGSMAVILTTARVADYCLPTLRRELNRLKISAPVLTLPDGERFKNLATVEKAYRGLIRLGADRQTPILLLGGGVLGDLGGFVAATYLRGVPFVHLPTTLVAQVDSSIGGKLGVDLPEGKNLVGVFQQPRAVLTHIPFLKTLPTREILGGLGEVLKYGVIERPPLFGLVAQKKERILGRDLDLLEEIVRESASIKTRVVETDEKETAGIRMILNFGHTFGHAIERLTRFRKFHHGEAIAIGMSMAGKISQKLGHCLPEASQELTEGIRRTGLPVDPPSFSRDQWVRAIAVDKKSRGGMIHFVFLKKIGEVTIKPIRPKELVKCL